MILTDLYASIADWIAGLQIGGWTTGTVIFVQFMLTRLAIAVAQIALLALRLVGNAVVLGATRLPIEPDDLHLKRIAADARIRHEALTQPWRWPNLRTGPHSYARRPARYREQQHPARSVAGWILSFAYHVFWGLVETVVDLARGLFGLTAPNLLALGFVMAFGRGRDLLAPGVHLLTGASGSTPQAWIGFLLAVFGVIGLVVSLTKVLDIRGVSEYRKQATGQAYEALAGLLHTADELKSAAWEFAEDLLDMAIEDAEVERHRMVLAEAWQRARQTVAEAASAYDRQFLLVGTAPRRARFLLWQLLDPDDAFGEALSSVRRPASGERTFMQMDHPGNAVLVHSAYEPADPDARRAYRRQTRLLVEIEVAAQHYRTAVEQRLNPGPVRRLLHLTAK